MAFLLSFIACESESNRLIDSRLFGQGDFEESDILPTKAILTFDPDKINFGTVQNGTANTKTITITNIFDYPVNIAVSHNNSVSTISFSESNIQIPANGSHVFTVIYKPMVTGFLNDNLKFTYPANLPNSSGPHTQTVTLTGNSVATLSTTLSVNPSGTIDFGTLIVGQTSTKNIILTNTGTAAAAWSPVGNVLSFNPNGGTIPVGGNQTVAMSLTASGTGVYTNTQNFSYNGGTVQVPYTVNRIAATKILNVICTTSTNFGNVPVNTTVSKIVQISNTGNSDLTVSQITTSQVQQNQYSCSYSGVIAPGATVNVPIYFKPTTKGSKTCTIIIQSDKTSGNNSLSFSGNGI